MHRILLSLLTFTGKRCLSAFQMAAWWRHIAEVCMLIFINTTLESCRPDGSRKASGRPSDVLESMFSRLRCRVQNPPFRSLSWSSAPGRWRWRRLRPKSAAVKTMPPNGWRLAAPPGLIACSKDPVGIGLLLSNASSLAGRLVKTWTSVNVIHTYERQYSRRVLL